MGMLMDKQIETEKKAVKSPAKVKEQEATLDPPKEINGRSAPEPTRYGDWEKNGRCIDF